MDIYGTIYSIIYLKTMEIVYIGQTVQLLHLRKVNHIYCSTVENPKQAISRAIKKYGIKNFKFEKIDHAYSLFELNLKEILWIEYTGSHTSLGKGYNVSWGGKGAGILAKETRQKISQSNTGRRFTIEHRKNISKTHTRPWLGRKHTEESKKIMSENNGMLGRKHSTETKEIMSKCKQGLNNPMSKFSLEDYTEIERLFNDNLSIKLIAERFNVWPNTIRKIKNKYL